MNRKELEKNAYYAFLKLVNDNEKEHVKVYNKRLLKMREKIGDTILAAKYGKIPKKKVAKEYKLTPEFKEEYEKRVKLFDKNNPPLEYEEITELKGKQRIRYNRCKSTLIRLVEEGETSFTYSKIEKEMKKDRLEEFFTDPWVNELINKLYDEYEKKLIGKLSNYLGNDRIYVRKGKDRREELNAIYLEELLNITVENGFSDALYIIANCPISLQFENELTAMYYNASSKRISKLSNTLYKNSGIRQEIKKVFRKKARQLTDELVLKLDRTFKYNKVLNYISENPYYKNLIKAMDERRKQEQLLLKNIVDHVPDNYIYLYPATRMMQRHFVLHIGPTNSGKTYAAVEKLMNSKNGIYLGPLRLLAYEQFCRMNEKAGICNLMTGEEQIVIGDVPFQASTIEMLDVNRQYECAVIDEAQMIEDEFRGGSWTRALLGLRADEIHVCAAMHAKDILIKIVESCGDTYEIVDHSRLCPLKPSAEPYYPEKVEAGDALIVFSKVKVRSLAAELQGKGIESSVIYGSLPYDVRHSEAEKFATGKTKVLVATDAIGMGLNLPIKRVVFLETEKFNGRNVRNLTRSEIQQIAGRAGRCGIYDVGYYAGVNSRNFEKEIKQITKARISFPETLIGIDSKLSDIMSKWNEIGDNGFYVKDYSDREISLAKILEKYTNDKELIYKYIMIPFDERNPDIMDYWLELFQEYLIDGTIRIDIPDTYKNLKDNEDLIEAEMAYERFDFLYQLCRKFEFNDYLESITHIKNVISRRIIKYLNDTKLQPKRCAKCGRIMPWNSPFKTCYYCHS
ncbi:MAG: hypothetical protein K6B68_11230 [Eubacterium sp.]|nr:hypothetical protein [Eubacterium sp.]